MSVETHQLIALVKAKTAEAYRKINSFTKLIGTSTKGMSAFQQAGAMAAGMLIRDMVQGATAALGESIKLGASLETLANSFDRLTKSQGVTDASLGELQEAVKGTISNVDLLTEANTALSFKIPYQQFKNYAAAAVVVGRSVGIDATQSVENFTVALGRLSPRILDNLGIQLQLGEANILYAQRLGKTVDALTESERRMAFTTIATEMLMEKAAILEGTTSEAQLATEQFSASMKNLKTAIGSVLTPLGTIAPILQGMMPMIGTFAGILIPKLIGEMGALNLVTAAWGTTTAWASKLVTTSILGIPIIGWVAGAVLAITALTEIIRRFGKASDELKDAQGRLAEAQQTNAEATRAQETALSELERATVSLEAVQSTEADAVAVLEEKTLDLERAQHNMGAVLAWLRGEVESVDLATEDLTWTSDEARERFEMLSDELRGLQDEFNRTSDVARGLQDQLDGLNIVEQQLRIEQMKLRKEYETPGVVMSLKQFEAANEEIEKRIRGVRTQQAELRLEQDKTSKSLGEQREEIEKVEEKASLLTQSDDSLEEASEGVADALEEVTEKQKETAKAMEVLAEKELAAADAAVVLKESLDALESKKIEVEVIETRKRMEEIEKERLEAQYGVPSLEEEIGHQHGFDGVVEKPTWFLAGEGPTPEHVKITPIASVGKGAPGGPGSVSIHVDLRGAYTTRPVDPEEIYRVVGDVTRRQMSKLGVKYAVV